MINHYNLFDIYNFGFLNYGIILKKIKIKNNKYKILNKK